MASEVIIIDDTPPSSPIKKSFEILDLTQEELYDSEKLSHPPVNRYQLDKCKKNRSTKNKMNLSIVDNIIDNPEISYEVINLTTTKRNETFNTNNTKHIQSQLCNRPNTNITINNSNSKYNFNYYPNSNYINSIKPENVQIGNYCFPIYENRTCMNSIPYSQQFLKNHSSYYYMKNAKLNENIKYVQPNLQSFYNFFEDYNSQFVPEYIDINNLINYNHFEKDLIKDLTFDKKQQTTENDTMSTTFKNNKRYNKNPVPLFLKRNRSVNTIPNNFNKMKVIDLSSDNRNEQKNINDIALNSNIEMIQESKDDDSDVVYVGAYAREPVYPELQPTIYKLPHMDINEQQQQQLLQQQQQQKQLLPNVETVVVESSSSSVSIDYNDKLNLEEKSHDTDSSSVKGKRKRKPIVTVPRRNPKRQVQIEKDYLKLLDNVLYESKKDVKVRKPKKTNKSNSSDDKKTHLESSGQNSKRATRQPTNCGAVYCPPSPLAKHHFRQWPVSGMHERPEYNPISGKIEPFDSIIRNISANFQHTKKNEEHCFKSNDDVKEESKSLSTLCHEMFHHVFAYGATIRTMQKEEKNEKKDLDKINFLKDLLLLDTNSNPLNLTVQNKTQNGIKYNSKEKSESREELLTIKELMENSLLLYCLTNNDVDRDQLSQYIDSLEPDELIKWSNKEFNLE